MTKKKKPRKRRSSPAISRPVNFLRRTGLWLLTSGVVALQATSCGFLPTTGPEFRQPDMDLLRAPCKTTPNWEAMASGCVRGSMIYRLFQ